MSRQHPVAQVQSPQPGRAETVPVVAVFALWTLFVWGGRLRNLWLDPGGFAEAGRWSLYGSLAFTVLGLAVATAWVVLRFRPTDAGTATARGSTTRVSTILRGSVMALAVLTIVVWLIRAVDISLGDHSAGFIAVHVALAVVSTGLAVASVRPVLGRAGAAIGGTPVGSSSEPGRSPVG